MQAALLILGYDHTYHGLDAADNWDNFIIWEKAADATFFGKRPRLLKQSIVQPIVSKNICIH